MKKTKEMLEIHQEEASFLCIVPEKRKEITTEGGLNLNHNKFFKKINKKIKRKKLT